VLSAGPDHLPELLELADARRDASERVEQRHDLVPGVNFTNELWP
jgi:hypothetical protein